MFSDEILEKIFCHEKTRCIPCEYKCAMISVIEEVLTEKDMLKGEETIDAEYEYTV